MGTLPLLRIFVWGILGASFNHDLNVLCLDFFLATPIFPPLWFVLLLALEMQGFLCWCLKNLSRNFFPGRVAYAGLVFLSGDVDSIENPLCVDLQLGFMVEFRSSARKQSWNGVRSLHKRVIGLEVGPEVWSSYNGKCLMGGGWEVWKLSQCQKSLRHNCKTNKVDIMRVNC